MNWNDRATSNQLSYIDRLRQQLGYSQFDMMKDFSYEKRLVRPNELSRWDASNLINWLKAKCDTEFEGDNLYAGNDEAFLDAFDY